MQICLTEEKSGLTVTVEAGLILTCRRDPGNPLITHVVMSIQGPNGLQAVSVREPCLEVARRVNAALKCDISPSLLGFPEN